MSRKRSRHRNRGERWLGLVTLAALAGGLSCGSDLDDQPGTTLSGVAYYTGPIDGATVTAWQLVDGSRTKELASATTAADGTWSLDLGLAYESIDLEVRGGSYSEPTGGTVTLDASAVLHGICLDVAPAEQRRDVAVTPWTDLVWTFGKARLALAKEASFNDAMHEALRLFSEHLTFDPTHTAIAGTGSPAGSLTEPVKHALSLAGLSDLAASIATEGSLTFRDVNSVTALRVLESDVGSAEALLDGNGDALVVGPACGLPTGCTARGDGCRSDCGVYDSTLRSVLARHVAGFLQRPENQTGLGRADVLSWLEHLTQNDPREDDGSFALFGGEPDSLDSGAPVIAWTDPTEAATVSGTMNIDVTANDPSGVASLIVEVLGTTNTAVTDTDATANRVVATVNTVGLAEGDLALRATAVDEEGNSASLEIHVAVDNIQGGVISGQVVKGPVGAAAVKVYRYTNGVKGTLLGELAATAADGSFTNLQLADFSGPIVIEAGTAGSYAEEAAPSTTVDLDVTDVLRAVVPDYHDGQTVGSIAVTPLTSFAVTYYEYLRTQQTGTFVEVFGAARTAMQEHFGISDISFVLPQRPAEMTTFSTPARYGLVLAGLSRTAWHASNQGGGDGGTFGTSMHALRVWKVLDQDLADGCWNGMAGPNALVYGGTQAVTANSTRKTLADAIVAYLGSPANQTPFTTAADILPLLETMSSSGPTSGSGDTCVAGQIFPTPGQNYDQIAPVVVFESPTPAAGLVHQSIMVHASATDNLTAPVASWAAPAGLVDSDGVTTNAIVTGTINTTTLSDGPLTVTAQAQDASGNVGQVSRTYTVDNTPPTLTWPTPSGPTWYIASNPEIWWTSVGTPTLTGSATDANGVSVTVLIGSSTYSATMNGSEWTVSVPVGSSATTVTVRATDAAGNTTSIAKTLRSDTMPPVVSAQITTIYNELNDTLTFPNHKAHHEHVSTGQVELGGAGGCPDVYKYTYLLDEGAPLYVTEGAKNSIRWGFVVNDVDGVGLEPTSITYRVRKGTAPDITYLTDWLAPSPLANTPDGYESKLFRKNSMGTAVLPDLGTYDGEMDVEMRGRDVFGRETIVTRCWKHHPLAPALEVTPPVQAADRVGTGDDIYALVGTSGPNRLALDDLTSPYEPVAAEVMSATQKGAALWGFEVWHGSSETTYATFATTAPATAATYTMQGQHSLVIESTQGTYNCGTTEDPATTPECTTAAQNPLPSLTDDPNATNATLGAVYSVRVFEDTGTTWTELSACTGDPSTGCEASDARREFVLPATAGTPKHYRVFLVIRGINDEFDLDAGAPYSETTLTTTTSSLIISGRLHGTTRRCNSNLVAQGSFMTCFGGKTYREYRMLNSASINFPTASLSANVETAPTLALTPIVKAPRSMAAVDWSTSEPTVPAQIP